jgi:hypothetical protein
MTDSFELEDVKAGTELNILTHNDLGQSFMKTVMKYDINNNLAYTVDDGGNKLPVILVAPITYNHGTVHGDSGGLLAIRGSQGECLVLGMHSGARNFGGESFGFSAPLTKSFVDDIVTQFKSQFERVEVGVPITKISNADSIVNVETESGPMEYEFPLKIDHYVSSTMASPMCNKSRIKRSMLHGWYGVPECIPAKMRVFERDGVKIDPYLIGVKKLHQEYTPEVPFNKKLCMDYLMFHYPPIDSSRLLTWEETIKGCLPLGLIPVMAGTSCGWPYNVEKKGKGKMNYIYQTADMSYDFLPEFLVHLQEQDEKLRRGHQIEVVWQDTLKD